MQPPRDRLTSKERVVATLVWEGYTNQEIAARIRTSEQGVKNHLRSAFDKLGVWSRLELALYVASHGGSHWENSAGVAEKAETAAGMPGTGTAISAAVGEATRAATGAATRLATVEPIRRISA